MATLETLMNRLGERLQDRDNQLWSRDRKRRALVDSAFGLAREGVFGEVMWLQAQGGQGKYDESDGIPAATVGIRHMAYDGRSLALLDERTFVRYNPLWEMDQRVPQYWTTDLQNLTSIRVAPTPIATGSSIPLIPGLPMSMPLEGNFLVFLHLTQLTPEQDEGIESGLTPPWEEVLILEAVATLTGDESEAGDQTKHAAFTQLAQLLKQALEG